MYNVGHGHQGDFIVVGSLDEAKKLMADRGVQEVALIHDLEGGRIIPSRIVVQQGIPVKIYNTSLKGHIPTRQFVPHYSTGSLEEYMLSFQAPDPSVNSAHSGFGQCFPMRQFERSPSPEVVQPVLNAIHEKRRIDLSYLSMSSTNYEDRIISPHSLVHTGSRWHVRAWCEKNQDFRDYVLSRITEVYNDEGPAEHTVETDIKWNTLIDITLEPDVRLPQDKKKVLAHDYCMEQGEDGRYTRTYNVRAAMVIYILHHLGLDRLREQSVAQQVMLTPESAERVKPYQG